MESEIIAFITSAATLAAAVVLVQALLESERRGRSRADRSEGGRKR